MTGIEDLRALASTAARRGGSLVFTGRELLAYLDADANPVVIAEPAFTAAEVAAAVAKALGMRKVPTESAVRKWARGGYRGVRLARVPAGRGQGYTREAVVEFVARVRALRTGGEIAERGNEVAMSTDDADPAIIIERFARRRG
jgi:hypothetical protein